MENGPFKSREELKKVKLIGSKTFEQCAGFLRIEPSTEDIDGYNLLDSTWIHPESYNLTEQIMKKCNVKKLNIGSAAFIGKIKEFLLKNSLEQLAKEFKQPKERVRIHCNVWSINFTEKRFIYRLKSWWMRWDENCYAITEKTW